MPASKILAVVYPDHVAIHTDERAQLKVVRAPEAPGGGIQGDLLVEQFIESQIGPTWSELLKLGYLRQTETTSELTVDEVVNAEADLWIHDVMSQAGEELRRRLAADKQDSMEDRVSCVI